MVCYIKPIPFKPPRLLGLSEALLASHYENHYGSAVRRLNDINAQLSEVEWPVAEWAGVTGLKREQLLASNSVILHEVYFDSMGGADGLGGEAVDPPGELADALIRDFGSVSQWRNEFVAMARALARGAGWVVLYWSPRLGHLSNVMVLDDAGALAGGVPILALDMAEHAYHLDFGVDAERYIEAWMNNVHWGRGATRFGAAQQDPLSGQPSETGASHGVTDTMRVEELQQLMSVGKTPYLLDVCLPEDKPARHDTLPGAHFVLSDSVANVIDTLPGDQPIVVYCMYGYQVSGNAVLQLRERGLDARKLVGGIATWRALGAITEDKIL